MYREPSPPSREGPSANVRRLLPVRPRFIAVVAVLLALPALLDPSWLLIWLGIMVSVGSLVALLLLPSRLRRRVVGVHDNGVSVRLPFRAAFVPWKDVLGVSERPGAKGATLYTIELRDLGEIDLPVAFAVEGGKILAQILDRAGLRWVDDKAPYRTAVRAEEDAKLRVAPGEEARSSGRGPAESADASAAEDESAESKAVT
jgi:hypothetical protein